MLPKIKELLNKLHQHAPRHPVKRHSMQRAAFGQIFEEVMQFSRRLEKSPHHSTYRAIREPHEICLVLAHFMRHDHRIEQR